MEMVVICDRQNQHSYIDLRERGRRGKIIKREQTLVIKEEEKPSQVRDTGSAQENHYQRIKREKTNRSRQTERTVVVRKIPLFLYFSVQHTFITSTTTSTAKCLIEAGHHHHHKSKSSKTKKIIMI